MKVRFLVSALSLFLFLSLSCSPLSHVSEHFCHSRLLHHYSSRDPYRLPNTGASMSESRMSEYGLTYLSLLHSLLHS